MIKALSGRRPQSSPETPPLRSPSPDRQRGGSSEPDLHTEFFPSEGFFTDGRKERILAPFPEIHHEGESNASKLEILPKPEEIRSKSPKIRSLRGAETGNVNMETAFQQELRYPERHSFQPSSEIHLKMNESPLSPRPALRGDPGPIPWFSQRVDTPVRVGDIREEDYGRMYHQTTSGGITMPGTRLKIKYSPSLLGQRLCLPVKWVSQ